jgi:hypothetical protein
MPHNESTPFNSLLKLARWQHLEPVLYTMLVVLQLIPVWVFPYVPTQDGPAHLANALILKECATGPTRFDQFFELRWEPFPNWTTHVFLAGLLYVFPPLVAHKVFVSVYLLGFAFSFRYFLAAFGGQTRQLAPAGLLFLYNRCFLTGFYNYCLSLIVLWFILGFCLRRRQAFGLVDAAFLMVLFGLAYFTHLLGYLLAGAGAACILAASPPHRLRKLGGLALAVLPTGCLAASTLLEPGRLGLRENLDQGVRRWPLHLSGQQWWQDVLSVNQGFFEPYEAWGVPLGILVLFFYEALLLAPLLEPAGKPEPDGKLPSRLPLVVFSCGIAVLYLVLPDFLSAAIGFLKARLVLLLPLLALACLRMPNQGTVRRVLTGFMYLLVAANLFFVLRYFSSANDELAEYTAGLRYAGHNGSLFVMQSRAGSQRVSYLEHAANYYCLTTGNVNLDNYQAELKHFPVRYRPGITRGRGSFDDYANPDLVDIILVWDGVPEFSSEVAARYRQVFQGGRLTLFAKVQPGT